MLYYSPKVSVGTYCLYLLPEQCPKKSYVNVDEKWLNGCSRRDPKARCVRVGGRYSTGWSKQMPQ